MAAVTIDGDIKYARTGRERLVTALITTPDNDDTWDTGLTSINHVDIAFPDGDLAAADAVSYTASGGTITFKVVGTARDLGVRVWGV